MIFCISGFLCQLSVSIVGISVGKVAFGIKKSSYISMSVVEIGEYLAFSGLTEKGISPTVSRKYVTFLICLGKGLTEFIGGI